MNRHNNMSEKLYRVNIILRMFQIYLFHFLFMGVGGGGGCFAAFVTIKFLVGFELGCIQKNKVS